MTQNFNIAAAIYHYNQMGHPLLLRTHRFLCSSVQHRVFLSIVFILISLKCFLKFRAGDIGLLLIFSALVMLTLMMGNTNPLMELNTFQAS